MEKKLLTVDEMAEYLSISRGMSYKMLSATPNMYAVRIGYRWYANKVMLDKWIDSITGLK